MFAIAFDLVVKDAEQNHPKGAQQAYSDIRKALEGYGYVWTQGSLYTCQEEDLAQLLMALNALKALPWFPASVRDIRAFRVEQWSDFTKYMKGP